MAEDDASTAEARTLVAAIIGSYLRHNKLAVAEIPALIASVHQSLMQLTTPVAPVPEPRTPAVPIRRSVQREYVTCLECGYRAQMLRRHLAVAHELTASDYRARWGLSADHKLTAPAYSERRSDMAKALGLGRRAAGPHASSTPTVAEEAPPARRRGRSRASSSA